MMYCPNCFSPEMRTKDALNIRAYKVESGGEWHSQCLVCAGYYDVPRLDGWEKRGWFSGDGADPVEAEKSRMPGLTNSYFLPLAIWLEARYTDLNGEEEPMWITLRPGQEPLDAHRMYFFSDFDEFNPHAGWWSDLSEEIGHCAYCGTPTEDMI